MAEFEPRFINLRILGIVVLLASLIFIATSLIGLMSDRDSDVWNVIFAISVVGAIIGFSFYGLTRLLLAVEANTYHQAENYNRFIKRLDQLTERLDKLSDNILLSEGAKSIAFRENDQRALRQAVEAEISKQDWKAALYLADQMEKKLGYTQETQRVRQRIHDVQKERLQQELAIESAKFEDLLAAHDWEGASRKIENIKNKFPNAMQISQFAERLELARNTHKKWFLHQWDQAVQKNRIDHGIEILKQLDVYLTPSEVAALEESARGVFRAKLHNLGVQFSLLVTEKVWDKALEVGNEIINEFPNSRMADEIKERRSALQARVEETKKQNDM